MSLSSLSRVSAAVSPIDGAGTAAAAAAFTPTSVCSGSTTGAQQPLSTADVANEFDDFKRRTHAVKAERDHYRQLNERATDAFEEHRRDLTQLAQKERAVRAHREDVLRAQLQQALETNRELMTRVMEQRRQHDEAWRAELEGHRADSAHRQLDLETLLAQLHTEREDLQRSVASAERVQDEYRRDLDACLAEQKQLQAKVSLLRDGLRGAEENDMHRDNSSGWSSGGAYESWPTQRSQRAQQPCCEYCDMPSWVWSGPSPTRRVPRRRFVPAGPWDACSPSPASSPATHHVDALVSSVERGNYLRPRLYLQRCGRETSPLLATSEPRFWCGDNAYEPKRNTSLYRSSGVSRSHGTASAQRKHHLCRSQGLSSTTASTTTNSSSSASAASSPPSSASSKPVASSSARVPAAGAPFFSLSSATTTDASAPVNRHKTEEQAHRGTRRGHSCKKGRHPSPNRRAVPESSLGVKDGTNHHALHLHQRALTSPLVAVTPAAVTQCSYNGSAINAVCHALLSDLADARAEYRRYQQQLRDPHGDSVEASQQMRRLMRVMDDKVNQIRTLRKEQEKHRDPLRVHDVLQQVIAENQYCGAVYKDLMELIRS